MATPNAALSPWRGRNFEGLSLINGVGLGWLCRPSVWLATWETNDWRGRADASSAATKGKVRGRDKHERYGHSQAFSGQAVGCARLARGRSAGIRRLDNGGREAQLQAGGAVQGAGGRAAGQQED